MKLINLNINMNLNIKRNKKYYIYNDDERPLRPNWSIGF